MFPTQSSEAGGRSHVTEVRPDQDTFEDGVGLSVKPIGHGMGLLVVEDQILRVGLTRKVKIP